MLVVLPEVVSSELFRFGFIEESVAKAIITYVSKNDVVIDVGAHSGFFSLLMSEIVETKYGFHIMQLIERRGEQINVRHILIKPVPNSEALLNAKNLADRIINLLNSDSISFSEAITIYSDDESKNNGGLLLNPNTMSTTHTLNDMSDKLRLQIEKLEEEDYTLPSLVEMPDESSAYRILHINKKIAEHKANLSDDFKMINEFAINEKKQRVLMSWIDETINKTYIRINDHNQKCDLKNNWIK